MKCRNISDYQCLFLIKFSLSIFCRMSANSFEMTGILIIFLIATEFFEFLYKTNFKVKFIVNTASNTIVDFTKME